MPLVACPSCKTTLKIPDGSAGKVKCPKCSTLFAVGTKPASSPAFEVVNDAPPRTATPPAPRPAAPPPPPPPKTAPVEFDFEVVDDETKSKPRRRDDDYDDDDDRPRGRGRGRRRDDDDDDDDRGRGRGRRRSRRRRDDYDDDDDWGPASGGTATANARVGVLLLSISSWLYFATFCIFALAILIGWAQSGSERTVRDWDDSRSSGEWIFVVIGLLGMGNWIVAGVGLGFCIAGPKKHRWAVITATSLAGAHLVLTAVSYSMVSGSILGTAGALTGTGNPGWLLVGTTMPFVNMFLPTLFYASKAIDGDFMVLMLCSACEIARLIFLFMTILAMAEHSRNYDASEKCVSGIVTTAIVVGAAAIVILLLVVLVAEKAFSSLRTVQNLGMAILLVISLGYCAMTLLLSLAAQSASQSLARRVR